MRPLTGDVERLEKFAVPAQLLQVPDHVHLSLLAIVRRARTAGIEQRRRAASKESQGEEKKGSPGSHEVRG